MKKGHWLLGLLFIAGSPVNAMSCIPSGDQTAINAVLNGPGAAAVLCADAVFNLTAPIQFTADGQQLYTQGLPIDNHRASLAIAAAGMTDAINGYGYNQITVKNVMVDGKIYVYGPLSGNALIFLGGDVTGTVVDHVKASFTRSWSTLQIHEGTTQCTNALITNNDIGPAGSDATNLWADGISFACRNSQVLNNLVSGATDGGIVLFGAPGTLVQGNVITAQNNTLLGGINMVDYSPYSGNYAGTLVTGNIINAQSAIVRMGIAMGPSAWGISGGPNVGGTVTGNTLAGYNFLHGFVANNVANWTVNGNVSMGCPNSGCGVVDASNGTYSDGQFLINNSNSSGNFQSEFSSGNAYLWDSINPNYDITFNGNIPVAFTQSLTGTLNTPIPIVLSGNTFTTGLPLTYAVTGTPAHGTLSGTAPNLTYTPRSGYTGKDSLNFVVNNGFANSPPATVNITEAGLPSTPFVLSIDRTNYLVGETPTYTISGATPNSQILWSSWLNGSSTGEVNDDYGQMTDSNGNWSSLAGASWSGANVGFWTKQALIGGTTAQINFYVSPNLASLTPGPSTPASQMLGIDDWDGNYPAFNLSPDPLPVEDAKLIQNLNAKAILIPMGPTISLDFPNTAFSANPINNLTDLAKSAPFQQIFSMSYSTYVLTAFAYSNPNYLTSPNPAAEQQEIANLVTYLLQTYQGTGKTFIIKNWEGDWAMSEAANGGTAVRPYTFSPQLLQNMTQWLNARHAGLVQGRTQAGAVSGVAVHDAAEFVWLTEGLENLPCMLTSVIPNVQSEYITYSSYDTINKYWNLSTLQRGVLDDLTYLRHDQGLNGRPLLIGEFGFSLANAPTDADQHMTIAAQAFMAASIPLAMYWVAADDASPSFGLVSAANTRTIVWNAFRTLLNPQNNAVIVSTSVPSLMVAGSTYTLSIQMKNTGNVPWNPVNTYQLMSQNPATNTVWGSSGAYFNASDSIAPNATKTFQLNVTAPATPGNYTMQWQMTEQVVGPFGPILSIPITVAVNQPPVVSAGPNQTMALPNYAVLQGTTTDDGLPYGILSTTWSLVSGPGSVIFSSTYTPITNASFSMAGSYVLQLTANDGALSGSGTVTVTVNPALPKPTSDVLGGPYDVVVVGAGSGGVSAAIQAARMGAKVALLEPTDWIGGQMTAAGVTSMDESPGFIYPDRESGIYKEFITKVQNYYGSLGKSVNTAYFDATHIAFEAGVGESLLFQMIQATRATPLPGGTLPTLHLSLYTQVTGVQKSGNQVTGVTVAINNPSSGPQTKTISAGIVIDATEEGDLLPLAGARYRSGNVTSDALTQTAVLQDLTYTAVMKRYPAGVPASLQTTAPSANYNTFKSDIFSNMVINGGNASVPAVFPIDWAQMHNAYRGMPDSSNPSSYTGVVGPQAEQITKTGINLTNDYPGNGTINDPGPRYIGPRWNGYLLNQYLEDPVYRQQINCQAKIMTLDFVYYVQHDLGHTDWALADDEGYDTSAYNIQQNSCGAVMPAAYQALEKYLPVMPYTRESRRLIGLHTMTASELNRTGPVQFDTGLGTALTHFTSSVAIGDYPADIHSVVNDSVLESSLETAAQYPNADLDGQFQVPFEAFVPEAVDGFLAAEKNISVSRIANGAIREQPITMLTGQAAGAIAALSVQKGVQPRNLNPIAVQAVLLNAQSTLSLYRFSDVPQSSLFWPSVELVSTHEIMHGLTSSVFDLTDALSREQLAIVTAKLLQLPTNNPSATPTFPDEPASAIGYPYVEALYVEGAVLGAAPGGNFLPNNNATRADVATFIASAMHLNLTAIPTTPYFTDVQAGNPAFPYIQALAQLNLLNSCGGGKFCPTAAEIRSQAAVDVATLLQNAVPTQLQPPTNQPPVVSAGSNQTITLPNYAVLQGTATDDGLPYGILSTTWTMVNGPGPVIFSSTYTPVTNANFSSSGTYVLQLTATDGALIASSSITITVNVLSPVVSLVISSNLVNSLSYTFNGSALDPTGLIAAALTYGDGSTVYAPSFVSGSTSVVILNQVHAYVSSGTYTVTLQAQNESGIITASSQTLIVTNPAPTVSLAATPSASNTLSYTFSGSASDVNSLYSILLNYGDVSPGYTVAPVYGSTTAAVNQTHVYASSGTYIISITAKSYAGAVAISSQTLVVTNPAPLISWTATPNSLNSLIYTFSGTVSDVNSVLSILINYGDGSPSYSDPYLTYGCTTAVVNQTHTYISSGTYIVTITAESFGTAVTISSQTIVVNFLPPVIPSAPVITSNLAATGQVGVPFNYLITASNNPTGFNATGLPAGLSVDTVAGTITGTPSAATSGAVSVTLSATNVGGTGNATFLLTIQPLSVVPPPPPPAPDLSSLDGKTFTPADTIVVPYTMPDTNFGWEFIPSNGEISVPAIATLSATSEGSAATLSTPSPRLTLSTLAIPAGTYLLRVQAIANGQASAWSTANITWISTLNLSGINVYPNPVRSARGDLGVNFKPLPENCTVKIFTVSGRWVQTLTVSGGQAFWDLTNGSGEKVASGLYLYLITDDQNDKVHGKIGVIR